MRLAGGGAMSNETYWPIQNSPPWETLKRFQDLAPDERELAMECKQDGWFDWELENARYFMHEGRIMLADCFPGVM
jgi:hypothetical protein